MQMRMLLATNNKHKLEELKKVLEPLKIELVSLKDLGLEVEVEENGSSFVENALIKAREVCKLSREITIADDSGLEVEALLGMPGIFSARYSGTVGENKDKNNNTKLLKELENVLEQDRKARFCCVIAAVFPDGREITAEGYVYGKIGYGEVGSNGFGYDPLFIVDGYNKTMAELSSEEKNKISHRANASKNFLEKIISLIY